MGRLMRIVSDVQSSIYFYAEFINMQGSADYAFSINVHTHGYETGIIHTSNTMVQRYSNKLSQAAAATAITVITDCNH